MAKRLSQGDSAPEFTFNTPWQSGLSFAKSIAPGGAVLIFLRYVGCPICRLDLAELKTAQPSFAEKDVAVMVVLQSTPESVKAQTSIEDWPITIICDPKQRLYTMYGVEGGGFFSYINPMGLGRLFRAFGQGFKHGTFEGRETQLPAAFVIGPDKKIRWALYGRYPADTPRPHELLGRL